MSDKEMEVEEQRPQDEAGPSKGTGPKSGGKRFEIKKWNAVAMWSWAICTDTCAICRNNLYEPSIEYQANPTGALLSPLYIVSVVGCSACLCSCCMHALATIYAPPST